MKTFLAVFALAFCTLFLVPDEADAGRGRQRRMARRQARQESRQMMRASYGGGMMMRGGHAGSCN